MNQPAPPPTELSNKNAKIMFGVFSVLTLLFCCGGALFTGIMGADRESAGVDAAMLMTGPACCSLSGLLVAAIAIFALKGNGALQIIAPIVAGIVGGFVGGAGIFVFFQAIWPSL